MRALPIGLFAVLLLSACSSAAAPDPIGDTIRVNGTVQRYNLEGGFWAVRGDDGVTYDPMNGLAPAFQREICACPSLQSAATIWVESTWLGRSSK